MVESAAAQAFGPPERWDRTFGMKPTCLFAEDRLQTAVIDYYPLRYYNRQRRYGAMKEQTAHAG